MAENTLVPRPLGPDVVITDIYLLSEEMGAFRMRIDRSGWGDPDRPDCWFEVGYAGNEIHVRTSDPNLRLRRDWASPDLLDETLALFESLIDQHRSGGTK